MRRRIIPGHNVLTAENLERQYRKFIGSEPAVTDFIAHDPVQFPRRYTRRADIEIAAFLTATIAWGRRDLILRSTEKMFTLMEGKPAEFMRSSAWSKLNGDAMHQVNIHRTFFESDLKYFYKGFCHCYAKYGSLENLFAAGMKTDKIKPEIWQAIALFRQEMAAANGGRHSKHISNPGNSACKRLNLALRWLIRPGPVDLGLWKKIKPAALYLPLDVHVARNSRRLGLLTRKSNDKKAVAELTEKLRSFCPEDPVKYDFVLFRDQ